MFDTRTLASHASLLADTTRVRLLALLSSGELSVRDLVAVLDQSQPRVSRHLKLLVDGGLVRRKAEGSFAYFRLVDVPARTILEQFLDENDPLLSRDRAALFKVRRAREREAQDYFAKVAPSWEKLRSRHVSVEAIEREVRDCLPDRFETMLDMGTGTGRMLELLAPHYGRGLGIDTSPEMLRLARTRLAKAGISHARVRQGDARGMAPDIAVPEDGFDVVLAHRVLVHSNEPDRIVEEAAHQLAANGRLLVVDFASHDLVQLATDQKHTRLGISDEEIAAWMRSGGLVPDEPRALVSPGEGKLVVKFWSAVARSEQVDRPASSSLTNAEPTTDPITSED